MLSTLATGRGDTRARRLGERSARVALQQSPLECLDPRTAPTDPSRFSLTLGRRLHLFAVHRRASEKNTGPRVHVLCCSWMCVRLSAGVSLPMTHSSFFVCDCAASADRTYVFSPTQHYHRVRPFRESESSQRRSPSLQSVLAWPQPPCLAARSSVILPTARSMGHPSIDSVNAPLRGRLGLERDCVQCPELGSPSSRRSFVRCASSGSTKNEWRSCASRICVVRIVFDFFSNCTDTHAPVSCRNDRHKTDSRAGTYCLGRLAEGHERMEERLGWRDPSRGTAHTTTKSHTHTSHEKHCTNVIRSFPPATRTYL